MPKMLSWPMAPPAGRQHGLPRLLATEAGSSLGQHLEDWGPMTCPPRALIDEVARAGLRGRGGAGFPTATKMDAVASRRRPTVVANGSEGEPASAKDKVLLKSAPHLVLDGATIAAQAVGAGEAFICVERGANTVVQSVADAIADRRRGGTQGVALHLVTTPNRYLAGEESALVHWLNGGDAKPTVTPPRPYERGVHARPTLIQNVETLAHLALIARYGSDWFRAVGSPDSGTALVTVSGIVARPVVLEVALGTTVADVVAAAGGSLRNSEAVLMGGYFGTWVPSSTAAAAHLGVDALRSIGTSMGCGVIAGLPAGTCGLAESARVTRWLADQSAGQCGPCFNGLPAIAGALETLVDGDRNGRAAKQVTRWLTMVEGRGACRHPDGAVRFVRSALSVFAADITGHRRHGPCRATPPMLPTPRSGTWR